MKEEYLSQSIEILNIPKSIIDIFTKKNILTISKLCKKTKQDLKEIGLIKAEIDKVEIELQLIGLDLGI